MSRPIVRTVLGPVPADELGRVMMHEHVLADSVVDMGRPALPDTVPDLWDAEVTPRNRAVIDRHVVNNRSNLLISDADVAVAELTTFARSGGGCVVDVTTVGMGPDSAGLVEVSRRSGVHVVAGAGVYVRQGHPDWLDDAGVEAIEDWLLEICAGGQGGDSVLPGIIGEIGLTWPPHPQEQRVLEASFRVAIRTGLAVSVHPGRHPSAPGEVARMAARCGIDPGRVILGHLDSRLATEAEFIDLAGSGCWLELDQFGIESAHSPYYPSRMMPNDGWRIGIVRSLIDAGHLDRVLISQDVAVKTRLRTYGGAGYSHILDNVVPMMRAHGFTDDTVEQLVTINPALALSA